MYRAHAVHMPCTYRARLYMQVRKDPALTTFLSDQPTTVHQVRKDYAADMKSSDVARQQKGVTVSSSR